MQKVLGLCVSIMIAVLLLTMMVAMIAWVLQWPLLPFIGNGSIVLMAYLLGILPSRHLVWACVLSQQEMDSPIPFKRLVMIVCTIMWPIFAVSWFLDLSSSIFRTTGLKNKIQCFWILFTLSPLPEEIEEVEMAEVVEEDQH